jgi:hypothetical protein
MKRGHWSIRRRLLVVAAALTAAAGLAVNEFATGADVPATATVCIKPNGQLRAVTPENPACVAPEEASEWTVGGVKAITAGSGLVGRDNNGLVQLEVDPGLIENANSGKIFAGFEDGPRDVPDEFSLIAQLPLPAGNYAIFAKLAFRHSGEAAFNAVANVYCKLVAGADFDETRVVLEPFDAESALSGEGTSAAGQSLEVVHGFDVPSRALLVCSDTSFLFPFGQVVYEDLKMIAIRGSSLSNTLLGG